MARKLDEFLRRLGEDEMRTLAVRTSSLFIRGGLTVAALACGSRPQSEPRGEESPASPKPQATGGGSVLAADEGEVIQRKGNTVIIKVDPKTGSPSMAMGTQRLDAGVGIPIHQHEREDEVLFVHEGRGVAVKGGRMTEVGEGHTVFIPHGVWHGVESQGEAVELLWVVTPPGLEGYFRGTGTPSGALPKALTPAQLDDIGRKHGVRFRH